MVNIIGILPMAGKGTRIQPIGFSKELYPVVHHGKHYAVSEFSVQSMLQAGATEIKLVIHPDKQDIARYYASRPYFSSIYFYSSPSLPESCLYPLPVIKDDDICLFGLPDTLFSPLTAHKKLVNALTENHLDLCLGLFTVDDASKYDSVKVNKQGIVEQVVVKQSPPLSQEIWGIWAARGKCLKLLNQHVQTQIVEGEERLLGVAFNALAKNSHVKMGSVKISSQYYDIGSMPAIVRANQVIEDFAWGT